MKTIGWYRTLTLGRQLSAVAAVLCLTCCFEEKGECPEGITLCFSGLNPKHDMAQVIEGVEVFLYGETGELVKDYTFGRTDLLKSGTAVHIDGFDFGHDYRVVATINGRDPFVTSGKNGYKTLETILTQAAAGELPLLFTGETTFRYTVTDTGRPEIPVVLTKHNKHVLLFTDTGIAGVEPLDAYIIADNGSYDYSSRISGGGNGLTYPAEKREGPDGNGNYTFRITTLRMWTGADVRLYIEKNKGTREGGDMIELDLIGLLASVKDGNGDQPYDTDEELEFEDEFRITVRIGENFVVTELTINGWSVITGEIPV